MCVLLAECMLIGHCVRGVYRKIRDLSFSAEWWGKEAANCGLTRVRVMWPCRNIISRSCSSEINLIIGNKFFLKWINSFVLKFLSLNRIYSRYNSFPSIYMHIYLAWICLCKLMLRVIRLLWISTTFVKMSKIIQQT